MKLAVWIAATIIGSISYGQSTLLKRMSNNLKWKMEQKTNQKVDKAIDDALDGNGKKKSTTRCLTPLAAIMCSKINLPSAI